MLILTTYKGNKIVNTDQIKTIETDTAGHVMAIFSDGTNEVLQTYNSHNEAQEAVIKIFTAATAKQDAYRMPEPDIEIEEVPFC